jgi:hypothetical protein
MTVAEVKATDRPRPLLVRALLVEPYAGDPPQLDALLEATLAPEYQKTVEGRKIERQFAAPPQGELAIPLARCWVVVAPNGKAVTANHVRGETAPAGTFTPDAHAYLVGCCSDPIVGEPVAESVAYINKRIDVSRAAMLAPESRVVVAMTNSWTKAYRLPLTQRLVHEVRWLALGRRRPLLRTLERVHSIGKKRSVGNGRVRQWLVEHLPDARVHRLWPWWVETEHGPLLMRTLPSGSWLPEGLIGARRDFRSCCPPYWHPERYTEVVVPC